MKKVKKQVRLNLESISSEPMSFSFNGCTIRELTYKFTSFEHIPNIESMEFYVEVDEPETFKEFKKENNLSSKEVVNWLNENYKR